MNTERTEKFVNAIACDLEEGGFRQVSGTMLRRTLATAVSAALPLLQSQAGTPSALQSTPQWRREMSDTKAVARWEIGFGGEFNTDPEMTQTDDGDYVTFTDHERVVRELENCQRLTDEVLADRHELVASLRAALAATGKPQVGAPWRDHDAAIDAKALATATEIALMWGQDRSQFVSRIQVAVIDAMKWIKSSQQPAQGIDLGQIVEQIAQQWDDCTYDAVGETIDIGEAIRAAGKRLIAQRGAAPGVGNG
ncbi:hypothetical protein [Stenotrophomonas rhizophila]|uniref:hypothetical protein n=1 Tax=Stenotrophomonas rhizophila TaxID=216778 RepID=UPI00112F44B9|nr:hypothetical protein [Stenotrophomonas rhizophila]